MSKEYNCRRRRLLGVTGAGLLTSIVGCLDRIDKTSGTKEPEGDKNTSVQGPSEPESKPTDSDDKKKELSGTVQLQFEGEDSDEPVTRWSIVNDTAETVLLATILVPSNEDGALNDASDYEMRHRIPSGQKGGLRIDEDSPDPELKPTGTWTESEYRKTEMEVDVAATPVGLETKTSPIDDSSWAEINYELPNPTGITGDEIRKITASPRREFIVDNNLERKAGEPELEVNSDGISFSAVGPIWTSAFDVSVSGVSESEEFTFTVDKQPEIDVSIDSVELGDSIQDPTVSFTAASEVPIDNPTVMMALKGPSSEYLSRRPSWNTGSARVSEDERVLITSTVGQERIGDSRTVTFDFNHGISYPLEESDVIAIGVISGGNVLESRYPIEYVERPLVEFAD